MEINELIEKYSDYIISIYKTGSDILPWIKNPQDKDYRVYINGANNKIRDELQKNPPKNSHYIVRDGNKRQHPRTHSYQKYFEKPLYGEDLDCNKYNIFENEKEYKQYLINYCSIRTYTPENKVWYHILTAIYLFDNGDYFITDEQAQNIQLCHDRKMTPEIYNYIKIRLNEWDEKLDNPN